MKDKHCLPKFFIAILTFSIQTKDPKWKPLNWDRTEPRLASPNTTSGAHTQRAYSALTSWCSSLLKLSTACPLSPSIKITGPPQITLLPAPYSGLPAM